MRQSQGPLVLHMFNRKRLPPTAVLATVLGFSVPLSVRCAHADEPAKQYIREQRTISVQGRNEDWQLVWDKRPYSTCGQNEINTAITCPCAGFAYGEYGKLWLVRRQSGHEIDRMDMGKLFDGAEHPSTDGAQGNAYVQRWPLQLRDYYREVKHDPNLLSEIAQRPAPSIMKFANYDHDGEAKEFLMQVGTLACFKGQFVAVGVSQSKPRLHALTLAEKPGTPIVLPLNAWLALSQTPNPTTVTTWTCGDHGSEARTDLTVSAVNGQIRIERRQFSCPSNGAAAKLIMQTDQP